MVGTRIYVGHLSRDANERDLERFFKGFGRVRDVLIKTGYGFVELADRRDAENAIRELNGKRVLGVRVKVEKARGLPRGRDQWTGHRDYRQYYNRNSYQGKNHYHDNHNGNERSGPPTRTDNRLIIRNLSSGISWQDLKDYMRQAGEVTYADAHKFKNEGVVEFATYAGMKKALETLDDTELNGRRIHLIEDRPRRAHKSLSYSTRSRSRSRSQRRTEFQPSSRSRSKTRSRSKSRFNRCRSASTPSPPSSALSPAKSMKSNSRDPSSTSRSPIPLSD